MKKEAEYELRIRENLAQAKSFIELNYDKKITISCMASEASLSKFHFIRLFKKMYLKTPYQYLMQVRIEKSLKLLKEGMTVGDVCFNVGFVEVSSFTHLFKRFVELSPSMYKKLIFKERSIQN